MPRHERRPIELTDHAEKRMLKRGISIELVEQIVRHGSTRPDADCDFIAFGSYEGRYIEVACLDLGNRIRVKATY